MSSPDRPRFEVVTAITEAAARRLVSVAAARAALGLAESDETQLARLLDAVSAQAATHCNLARAGSSPPTFGREILRATWRARTAGYDGAFGLCGRGRELRLPWRLPIVDVGITEAGVELEQGVDFDLLDGACTVERMGGNWSFGEIVANWTAGWDLGEPDDPSVDPVDGPPEDLSARVIDQVKLLRDRLVNDQDQNLRSEDIPGLWAGSYNVDGGTAIATSGMLRSLEAALAPFRLPVI